MTCKSYSEDFLFSYTLGELNQQEENDMKNHLESCSACENQVKEFLSFQEAWNNPVDIQVSDSVMKNVMAEIIPSKIDSYVVPIRKKNALIHFALATAATFFLLYSGIFDQMYQSVGEFTTTFSETTNQVQQASVQGVNWLNVNFNFSQLMYDLKK